MWGDVGRVAAGCGVAQASAPTAKGEGWGWADEKRTERASSDGKTLLMLGLGGVEGSIRESARDTEPWDKENPITAIVSGIVGEKIIISHGAHDNDSFF